MRVPTVASRCRLFFNFFSTISNFLIFPKKVIGPDASENILDRPGGVREGLLVHPGGSRRPLGGSWDSPGGSWGRLGRVLGALGAILERPLRQSDFGSFF